MCVLLGFRGERATRVHQPSRAQTATFVNAVGPGPRAMSVILGMGV